MWIQKSITLKARPRGFHLITDEILFQLPELSNFDVGLVHILLQHTSASITVNENADPSVRQDFESYFNRVAAENEPYYIHTYEGSDDMPAHLKASLLGCELTLPISQGQLALGIWQGIYLGEHRNHGGSRQLLITLNGE
ncbi:secondary thiamine-phosphate synthase enzyme YjbQ [Shewanella donghaensis]|uniref:secondary thiamine-phosphate synthase enzyme YjbQ n=1 Tax=Shewanella donghaensis TaxID=238836 RepID=UPI00118277C3|nr:secondary thiamine-phosphate synthase enzyme YjbQ [Shewanella donghaensis]